jgi:hypothetical protein
MEKFMKKITGEEADALDEYYAKKTLKVDPGKLVKRYGNRLLPQYNTNLLFLI